MGPLQHLNVRSCYPEAKRLCETMLEVYRTQYGLSYCGVRMSHTLGPGIDLEDGRAFAEFLKCTLEGKDIVLLSEGRALRTYTYIPDAVNAMFLVMQKGQDGFYNVVNESNVISIRELAELIAGLDLEGRTEVRFGGVPSSLPYLQFELAIEDSSKIRTLGWEPKVGLDQMFKWTYESFI
ncbi:hypothetical protein JI75_08250 [Berryella intestinalis]|uniref:NAD-dependent epimerase/dehydratase domain-containing protein n=2 Tax=Berryella intestinalis TaxID=1531429 RepID=A0A0A8B5G4_9ACTN|nr:hypothetical protein JI75_08250 [Berryella intestinalis]